MNIRDAVKTLISNWQLQAEIRRTRREWARSDVHKFRSPGMEALKRVAGEIQAMDEILELLRRRDCSRGLLTGSGHTRRVGREQSQEVEVQVGGGWVRVKGGPRAQIKYDRAKNGGNPGSFCIFKGCHLINPYAFRIKSRL